MTARLFRVWGVFLWLALALSLPVNGEETTTEDKGSNTETEGSDTETLDVEKRVHLIPESKKQAALADESVKNQIVWLESSEGGVASEGGVNSFLALELYEKAAESQGAVIFLHGAEQHPNWPNVIKPLRTLLTEDGWYTLSIMLPYKHTELPPSRDLQAKQSESVIASDTAPRYSGRYSKLDSLKKDKEGSDPAEGEVSENDSSEVADSVDDEAEPTETAADLALKDSGEKVIDISANEDASVPSEMPFEERVQMRLKAALDHIAQKNYQNIILVGYQQGAQGVLEYLSRNKGLLPEQGLAVIWVDARLTDSQQLNFGELVGKEFPLQIFDVVDSSSRAGIAAGKNRSGQAKRNSYGGYSLAKLPIEHTGSMEVNTLSQRIRGWLKVNAPGMKTTVKKAN